MEDLAPSPSLFFSNMGTFLISLAVFCMFARWGLPRLGRLSNSNPSTTQSQPQNAEDSTPGRPYDVFLNHRGPDVKNSLASTIYHWLQDKRMRVFLDREEFQAGEGLHPTIQHAIHSASVHVAIFSRRYAESSWCLDELCAMLESGAKIIPVFYDVRPYELRWAGAGKGVYASAFSKHRKNGRVAPEKLVQWKQALHDVSNLHGFELNGDEFNGDQGKLLKRIVDSVSEAVAEKAQLEPAKDPVGLDEAVEDFHNFIQSEAQRRGEEGEPVKIVGIVGFGGAGKTTLARHFYNIQRASFTASSFLSEVRHRAAPQHVQSQLLNDLLHIRDDTIERLSVSDGRAILANKLRSSAPRVLVILDDIDHEKQTEDLVPVEALGSGSLILLTSRNETPLRKSGADPIYKIKPLKSNHALELFCRHAFRQPWPKTGFEDLAKIAWKKCGGLPLFLKVMGAHLRDIGRDDKDIWHEELENVPDDIENLLKVIYDALPKDEQQMLLDVASFFSKKDRSTAIRVWSASDRRASIRLQNLESKCLVEVDDRNRLKLHDHVKDFGRNIAEQESPYRFWHQSQIIDTREVQGKREVRGIMLNKRLFSYEFFDDLMLNSTFENIELSKLKVLAIRGDSFESRFQQQATNLIWLYWYKCPHTNIPSTFMSMKNLTVLHITGRLEKWEVCDALLALKELVIQRTRLSYVSVDEKTCPQLEHLDLSYNPLQSIQGLELLSKLQCLRVSGCSELGELPNLSGLTSLEELKAWSCIKLQSIRGLELLSKLRMFNVSGCSQLDELPNLSGLTSLEMIETWDCIKLQSIQGLELLSKLRILNVSRCYELGELPNLSGLTSLEKLKAWHCSKLQSIRGLELLSKHRMLNVSRCYELGELPNLSGLTSLEEIDASCCIKLQSIQGLEVLSKLRMLDVSGCSELGELPNLSGLTSLERIETSDCIKLQSIQGLEFLSKLQSLRVSGCSELGELPNLSGLTSLERIEASDCIKLQSIQGLEFLSKLQCLRVSGCSELGELPNLSGLTSLEEINALGCSKLQSIEGLELLSKLQSLGVSQCSELSKFPNLSGLTSLKKLTITDCSKLQSIQGLELLSKIRMLDISGCSELHELPNLLGLTSLETLETSGCTKLKNIGSMESLSRLQTLRVDNCPELRELPNLSDLASLRRLEISGCDKLQRIQGLEHLSGLLHLIVAKCSELVELPNLSGLTSLETLQASRCNKLKSISGVEDLSKLEYLIVDGCCKLRELPNLSGLTSLVTLEAAGCCILRSIQGLEHLSKLRYLIFDNCFELEEISDLSGLDSLEMLGASGCRKLKNIGGLEHLSKLQRCSLF